MTARELSPAQAAARTFSDRALAAIAAGLGDPAPVVEAVRELAARERWVHWGTVYVDASNAGGPAHTHPGERPSALWAWGARGRIHEELAGLANVEHTFIADGGLEHLGPVARSDLAELWGIVGAVEHALRVWPFLEGVGVRCDNQSAVAAVAGCDGREHKPCKDKAVQAARDALRAVLRRAGGVLVRATHIRGHGRAEHDRQRAFNAHCDELARQRAVAINTTRPERHDR